MSLADEFKKLTGDNATVTVDQATLAKDQATDTADDTAFAADLAAKAPNGAVISNGDGTFTVLMPITTPPGYTATTLPDAGSL